MTLTSFQIAPSICASAINHLLTQEPEARGVLAQHAGRIAVFDMGAIVLRLRVAANGLVEEVLDDTTIANVTIRIKWSDLPLIIQNRERAFSYVKLEGDADFANVISRLSQSLSWDAEEDLSKLLGDIAAVRVVGGAKKALKTIRATHQKFTENVAEYFLEENPMVIRPQAVTEFADDVIKLRNDVERLSKRIEKLESGAT